MSKVRVDFRVEQLPGDMPAGGKWAAFIDALRAIPYGQCAVIAVENYRQVKAVRAALYENRHLRPDEKIRISAEGTTCRVWLEPKRKPNA